MAHDERDEVTQAAAPFDYEAEVSKLWSHMRAVHIPRIAELPTIELYLDQVLTIVCDALAPITMPGEAILTGAMVNNYVKQRIVPAPVRKRYGRRHVAMLVYVCVFKRVCPMAEIRGLADACFSSGVDVGRAYDDLCEAIERTLAHRFSQRSEDAPDVPNAVRFHDEAGDECAPELARIMSTAVEAVADRVFVEQCATLYARAREQGLRP